MDFSFTKEQEQLREEIREFCAQEVPKINFKELEEKEEFPSEYDKKIANKGWVKRVLPKEYGGDGYGLMEFAIICEELMKGGYPETYLITIFNALNLINHGNEKQRQAYIPKVITGETILSISMTEPNAGSDIASLKTRAIAEGDEFVLNGQKTFATRAAPQNNVMILAARTSDRGPKYKGLSMFLVPANTPGLKFRKIDTMGRRIDGTYEVFLDNVRVPKDNLLGGLNEGWKILISGLDMERAIVSIRYVGWGDRILNDCLEYLRERRAQGRILSNKKDILIKLADMKCYLDQARVLTYRVLWMVNEGKVCTKEASITKYYVSELIKKMSDLGMEITGGYGYLKSSPMERHYRESRVMTITGGSSNIMLTIIGRMMGLNVK